MSGLFDGRTYTKAEREEAEALRSRINVSQALLDARLAHDLTQAEIARKAGTTQSRVSQIEAMIGNPTLDSLDRIARSVGLMVTLVPRSKRAEEAPRAR